MAFGRESLVPRLNVSRCRVGAKFIVCHNRSYRLLKDSLVAYWRESNVNSNEFPASFDIDDPVLDYVSLARGLGVPGARVPRPAEIAPAIGQMLDRGPFLLEVMLEDAVHLSLERRRAGQAQMMATRELLHTI